jgi:alkylresorcinol/alkylpyrone synthase
MSPSAKLVSLATAVPANVLSQSDVAAAANQCFGGRYDEFERLARVFKSSAIRRRHPVRPIDWYLTPLGWQERATVYLEAGGLGAESALELTGVSLIPETGAA